MPPTGRQFVIAAGPARAIVTEVGAGLRAFDVHGRAYCETFPEDSHPPLGSGALLAPWPNRVARGSWVWRGRPQQLALTEPAAGNAIHGLLRHVLWGIVEHASDAVELAAVVTAQPGWPEPVRVTARYAVSSDGLAVTVTAENRGARDVPFGLGAHPYLRLGDVPTEDCVLHLAATERLPLDGQLPAGPLRPLAVEDRDRPLRGARLDATFGGCMPAVGDDRVRHRLFAPGAGLELWADPDFRWVQVFTPDDFPGRGRAVAVEPMTCPPDALNAGTDLIVLAPGERWSGGWGLRLLG
ncbi:aldose 1-epimerase family protein [Pseudonocardia asaccharolytica]|nr:aldose 1-epimerase family protein [Pseudonocardia asaccharolytica]